MAENLSDFLREAGISAKYMHHETDTLERHEIIRELRLGEIDVIVGINLLREGLDIPGSLSWPYLRLIRPVSFVPETALVQTMGRAARNQNGHAIMYGDRKTDAMKAAISETQRRRQIQTEFNEENNKTPKTIEKKSPNQPFPVKTRIKNYRNQLLR